MINNFILLGHQRSGTSYVLDVIRHNNNIDTINEPFSMHIDFFRENEKEWNSSEYNIKYLHPSLKEKPYTIDFINNLNKWIHSPINNIKGFKETALFEKYSWLHKMMTPDITIILLRHPLDVIYSVVKRDMHNSWWDYKDKLSFYMEDKQVKSIKSDYILCAYIWKFRINNLISIIESESIDTYTLRLEDVIDNPIKEIDDLMKKMGLKIDNSQKNFLKETKKETKNSTYSNFRKKEDVIDGGKKNIPIEERKFIEKLLENELKYFGYN